MSYSTNELMKFKKAELIEMVLNLQNANDILFDRAENLKEELNEVETYEEEFKELSKLKGIINNYKIAKERSLLGVSYAREEETKLLDKILDYAD